MGLAISIVSAAPERVWYCTKKGYKPWFEPNKKNTKLVTEGGHTKWFDEPSIIKQVERRLKRKVLHLEDDMSLPKEIKSKNAKYGESQQDSGASKEVVERVAALKPIVQVLSDLEVTAQRTFLQNFHTFIHQASG